MMYHLKKGGRFVFTAGLLAVSTPVSFDVSAEEPEGVTVEPQPPGAADESAGSPADDPSAAPETGPPAASDGTAPTTDDAPASPSAESTAQTDAQPGEHQSASAPEGDHESSPEDETANPTAQNADEEPVEEIEEIEVIEAVDADESRFFPSEFDGVNTIRRDRGVNIFTARTTRKRALLFIVDHRPFDNLFSGKEAFFNFLGLDGNLKIGLGLRYGIIDGLDVGMVRLNDAGVLFDTYEWDLRWGFLKQEKHHIDASVRAGVTWFAQLDVKDAAGGFAQAFVDRVFFDMLLVGLGFAFHSSSTNDEKLSVDAAYSGAILGLLEWRMVDWLAWTAEVAATLFGYRSDWPTFSFAVKFLTHRHSFSLILTNTQFIAADGIVANSWRDFSDIVFGFQIIREFNFGDRDD